MQAACDLAKAEEPEHRLRPAQPLPQRLPGDASSGSTTARSATSSPSRRCSSAGRTASVRRDPEPERDRSTSSATGTTSAGSPATTCRSRWSTTWTAWPGSSRRRCPNGASAWAAGRPRSARSTATCSTITRSSTSTPAACGSTPSAAPRNGCYGNSSDIIMGTKGTCHLGNCQIEGKNTWQFTGSPERSLSRRAEGPDRLGPHRQADQQRLPHDQQHAGRRDGPDGLLHRHADHLGGGPALAPAVRPGSGGFEFRTKPPTLPDKTGNYPLPRPGVTRPGQQA